LNSNSAAKDSVIAATKSVSWQEFSQFRLLSTDHIGIFCDRQFINVFKGADRVAVSEAQQLREAKAPRTPGNGFSSKKRPVTE